MRKCKVENSCDPKTEHWVHRPGLFHGRKLRVNPGISLWTLATRQHGRRRVSQPRELRWQRTESPRSYSQRATAVYSAWPWHHLRLSADMCREPWKSSVKTTDVGTEAGAPTTRPQISLQTDHNLILTPKCLSGLFKIKLSITSCLAQTRTKQEKLLLLFQWCYLLHKSPDAIIEWATPTSLHVFHDRRVRLSQRRKIKSSATVYTKHSHSWEIDSRSPGQQIFRRLWNPSVHQLL